MRDPLVAGLGGEHRLEPVPHPVAVGGQQHVLQLAADALVVEHVGQAQGDDGLALELGQQGGQEQPLAVGALVAGVQGTRAAGAVGRLPLRRGRVDHERAGGGDHHAVHAADGDDLAVPGALALDQRGHDRRPGPDGLGVEHVGEGGVDRAAGVRVLPQGEPGVGVQQGGGLPAAGPRHGVEVRGYPQVDQRGVGRAAASGVAASGRLRVVVAAGDDDVGAGQQGGQPGLAVRGAGVDDHAALVAVPHGEARAAAARITAGRLDLDDVRPEVGQEHGGGGTGDPGAQVHDPEAVQRAGNLRSGRMSSGRPREPP